MHLAPPHVQVGIDFFRAHGRFPNLTTPQTFNEKIAWRKLFDFDPRLPPLVDKIKSKEFIRGRYGSDLVIPTIAIFDTAEEIDFDRLQRPYVIKANHGSSMNLFVRDTKIDKTTLRRKAATFLTTDFSEIFQEWAYSKVDRKLFAEPLLATPAGYLTDYKFHVFGGKVLAIEVVHDRYGNYGAYFCDRQFNYMNVRLKGYPSYKGTRIPPSRLKEMIELSEALGAEFTYVRVDLYEIDQNIKFGEFTFYPGAGHDPFDPPEWDLAFGRQWTLPVQP